MAWSDKNNQQLFTDNDLSIAVVQSFVHASDAAETFEEINDALLKVLAESMGTEYTSIFELIPKENKVFQRVKRSLHPGAVFCREEYAFGECMIGTVAQTQQSILVADSRLSELYNDSESVFSAICVPVQFHGELMGVVFSCHTTPGFFQEQHRKLHELIAEIAASLLARIRQKIELNHLKIKLEHLLEEKKEALDIAVETVSNQFSELKFQRDKKEILLREVHHRVNNNLQIISSLVSLYLSETKNPGKETLRTIQSRIQVLSSIHLILLKSLELSEISVSGFLEDLCGSLRYNSSSNYLSLKFTTDNIQSSLSFNTLIPMGMLIHELVQLSVAKFWEPQELVELMIHLSLNPDSSLYELEITGVNCGAAKRDVANENVQQTIIKALCEQLEGGIIETDAENCTWKFTFREV